MASHGEVHTALSVTPWLDPVTALRGEQQERRRTEGTEKALGKGGHSKGVGGCIAGIPSLSHHLFLKLLLVWTP